MLSCSLLPVSLLALIFASQALAAPTTPNDPFHDIAVLISKQAEQPICCLRPLEPVETTTEEGLLLSFEDWKAKRFAEDHQPSVHSPAISGHRPLPDAMSEPTGSNGLVAPSQAEGAALNAVQQEDSGVPDERSSPHFRIPLTDRFNYASLDCSARVHTAHRSAKSSSAILSDKKDRYMLSPCAEEKQYVVVELCDDIRIDTVQLANFEFFSGVFKDFTVSVAKTYTIDPDGWTIAGTYRARNTRGVQSFHPPTSLRDFYRFIRIDFLSHYGSEYYCPVSLLRVYGLTHLEQWKWDMWETESKAKRSAEEASASVEIAESPQTVHIPIVEAVKPQEVMDEVHASIATVATPTPHSSVPLSSNEADGASTENSTADSEDAVIHFTEKIASPRRPSSSSGPSTAVDANGTEPSDIGVTTFTSTVDESLQTPETEETHERHIYEDSLYDTIMDIPPVDTAAPSASSAYLIHPPSHSPDSSNNAPPSVHLSSLTAFSSSTSSILTVTGSAYPLPQPLSPVATGGESVYRTIMNRLMMLEANTTLYTRYVEEQTTGVREVLRRLGEDVGRLEGIGKAQAQIYQRSVQDFEKYRRHLDTEYFELLSKVNHLADEVVILEKRLGIAQLCLLLAVLVFMSLTRGSRGEHVHGRPSSMRDWGRRTLSLSGDWMSRLRTRSSTPPPPQPPSRALDESFVEFPSRAPQTAEEKPLTLQIQPVSSAHKVGARPRTPLALRTSNSRHNIFNRSVAHGGVHASPSSALSRPQIQRSSSGHGFGGIGPVPRSAKKLARSAHLHEVKSTSGAPNSECKTTDKNTGHPLSERARRPEDVIDTSVDIFSPQSHTAVLETPSVDAARSKHPDDRHPLSPLRLPTANDLPHGCACEGPLPEGDTSEADGWVDTDADGSESELG
ncbi:UNC-like C-terminal-domain-containing protein [Sparassis latifolia]